MVSTEQFFPGSSCGRMFADDAVLEGWSGQDISASYMFGGWCQLSCQPGGLTVLICLNCPSLAPKVPHPKTPPLPWEKSCFQQLLQKIRGKVQNPYGSPQNRGWKPQWLFFPLTTDVGDQDFAVSNNGSSMTSIPWWNLCVWFTCIIINSPSVTLPVD